MSIAAITSNPVDYTPTESRLQQFRQGFEQLGQDLQSGNLAAAKADFADLPKPGEAGGSQQINSPIEQSFLQLRHSLVTGNLSGATQAYKEIQQDIQNRLAHRVEPVGPTPQPITPSIPAPATAGASVSVSA